MAPSLCAALAAAIRQFSCKIDVTRGERFVEVAGTTIRTVSRGMIGISPFR
jgi:hypothetical protein